MGGDIDMLKIMSMNSCGRKGKQFMDYRRSCFETIIGENKPDALFLPGDKPEKSTVLEDYEQVKVPHNDETMLLYDTKRLRLRNDDWHGSIPPVDASLIDMNKLMYPVMDIVSAPPMQDVVKSFRCISWHWELTQATSDDLYRCAEWYLNLAQFLAWQSGVEVLVGGDFNLQIEQIQDILKRHNKLVEKDIDDIKPIAQKLGYMDCMTEYVHRPVRRLRQLHLHKCKTSNGSSNEYEYFVASKEMQLVNTKIIEMPKLTDTCATTTKARTAPFENFNLPQTQMHVPFRPPRHNGG